MSDDDAAITTPTTRKKTVVVLPSSDSPTNDTNKSTVITKKRVSYNHNNNNKKNNMMMMNDTWYQLSKGWSDASNITHLLKLFAKSPKFQVIFRSCFLLNGLIFVGSILVLDYIFSPLFFHLIGSAITASSSSSSSSSHFNDEMTTRTRTTGSGLLSILYLSIKNMFWMWPMYTISLALCTSWYNHVADLAYRYSQKVAHLRNHRASTRNSFNNNSSDDFSSSLKNSGNNSTGNSGSSGSSGMDDVTRTRTVIVDKVSDGIYRSILLLVFLLQMNLLGSLPSFIGPIVSLCLTSWLYAFYAFDYVWTYKNYNTQQRLNYFERHWAYMLGFGAPNALTSYFFPFFINAGVWAMLFPIFIVLAMMANPPPVAPDTKPLPIFYFVKKCLNYVLLTIGDVIAKKMKQSPSVNSVASPPSAFSMNIAKVFLQDDEDAADDGDDDDSKRKTEPMKE